MGSGSVSDSVPNQGGGGENCPAPLSAYRDLFEEQFPYYLSIGMTAEEYWDGDPTLTRAYRQADEMRWDRRNHELWLQGMYVYEAICCCVPVLRAFSKERRPGKYPAEPYSLNERQKRKREEQKEISTDKKIKDKFEAFMDGFNKNFAKGGKEYGGDRSIGAGDNQ